MSMQVKAIHPGRGLPVFLIVSALLLAGCGMYIGVPAGPGGALPNPVKTIAGSPGVRGSADGLGPAASFSNPQGVIAVGATLYISDTDNNAIRRLDTGTNAVTTLAAGFNSPHGIASDGTNLYVANTYDHTIKQVVIATGAVSLLAGASGTQGSANGVGALASFNFPYGVAQSGGKLYVTDSYNHTIRAIDIATATVSTFAGLAGTSGSADGVGAAARFSFPCGITTDGTNLYVTDVGSSTVRQVVIATATVSTPAGQVGVTGSTDGVGNAATFNAPVGLATDGSNVFIADTYNNTMRQVVLSGATVTTLAGQPGLPGSIDGGKYSSSGVYPIPPALLNHPAGIAVIGGAQYVVDTGNNVIRAIH
jgi:sugar lactone lactonase YvrE